MAPSSNGGAAVTDYVIQRSVSGGSWVTITDGVRTTTTYTVTGLTQRDPLLLPGVRHERRRQLGVLEHRQRHPAHRADSSALVDGVADRTCQVRSVWRGRHRRRTAVQRSPTTSSNALSGTSWVTITDGVRTTTSYTVTGLSNGTRYYFRVLAKNAAGTGPSSNVVNQIPRTVPSAPRTLTATPSSGRVVLRWTPPASTGGAPITRYAIQRSTSPTSGWVNISTTIPATARSFTATNLRNGTRYYFRIAAINAAGMGAVERASQRRAEVTAAQS